MDTSLQVAELTFKSPLLVSSSEWAFHPSQLEALTQRSIGGIVTKTFTTAPENRIRLRPYQFPLARFGKGYREGGSLFSLASPHVKDVRTALHHVSLMADACHDASLILIGSYFENPEDIHLWTESAQAFQDAGADMLELNFSSPSAMSVFARNITRSTEILARVREKISIPVGLKLSPTLEPLETLVASWTDAGLDFITAHNAPSGILIDVESLTPFGAPAIGGYVSGRPFLPYSLARVVRIKRVSDIPVIGVGGIYEGSDALQYLLAGCPLVGVGSALYFKGPGVLDDIYQGLTEWMRRKGFRHIEEFRGKVLPLIRGASALKSEEEHAFTMPPDCPYAPSIDHDRCTRCGTCTTSCIYGALILAREKQQVVVLEERCWSCGFCVGICPVGAIELRERLKPKRLIWNNQGVARSFVKGV